MNGSELLAGLVSKGFILTVEGANGLRVSPTSHQLTERLRELIRENKAELLDLLRPVPFTLVNDPAGLPAVVEAICGSNFVGLDTETTGLDAHRDRVRLLQLAPDGGELVYVIDLFALDTATLAPVFEALAGACLVAHNASFDLAFLRPLGFNPRVVHDTMIHSRLLHGTRNPKGFHGLKEVVARELGRPMDKTEQVSDWAGGLTQGQLKYAAADAAVLVPLCHALRDKLRAADMSRVAAIERRCVPAVAWLAGNGVTIDRPAWEALTAEAEAESSRLEAELHAIAPPKPPPEKGNKPKGADPAAWNFNSHPQLLKLFELLGTPVSSTADGVLATVKHPFAALLRQYRTARKLVGTYGKKWLANVADDGRVYANWKQLGSDAGRMSCSGPNLQQLPRDKRYRRCFVAPPGRVLVKADYSQIELRIAAKVSGDEALLETYRDGGDIHVRTAVTIATDTAIRSTELLCLWAGLPADGAGAEVLPYLWTGPAARTVSAMQLRLRRKDGADQTIGGRVRGRPDRGSEPSLEGWGIAAAACGVPEALLRAVREYAVPGSAPQGQGSRQQRRVELRDALSVLPFVGTPTLAELDARWPELRQLAKVCGFGLLYGMGARTFRVYARQNYGLEMSEGEATRYRDGFFQTYPGLAAWHARERRAADKCRRSYREGETRTLAGRRRVIRPDDPPTFRLNSPVQGTGADGLKLALALLWKHRAECPDAFPVLAVHDEIVVECDEPSAGAAAEWLRRTMIDAMAPLIDPVPVEVDVKVGGSWGSCVPVAEWDALSSGTSADRTDTTTGGTAITTIIPGKQGEIMSEVVSAPREVLSATGGPELFVVWRRTHDGAPWQEVFTGTARDCWRWGGALTGADDEAAHLCLPAGHNPEETVREAIRRGHRRRQQARRSRRPPRPEPSKCGRWRLWRRKDRGPWELLARYGSHDAAVDAVDPRDWPGCPGRVEWAVTEGTDPPAADARPVCWVEEGESGEMVAAPIPGPVAPVLKWHGSKAGLAGRIAALMPPHEVFVEPFAGSAAVLLAKPPAADEVLGDLDRDLIRFYRTIRDPEALDRFLALAREEALSWPELPPGPGEPDPIADAFRHARAALDGPPGGDAVKRALAFFLASRLSMSGRMKNPAPPPKNGRLRRSMDERKSGFLTALDNLPVVSGRLRNVRLRNKPAVEVIKGEDGPQTLFYLDPPYVKGTRASPEVYRHDDMGEADHRELLDALQSVKGKVMLSGYPSELYDEMLAGWNRNEWPVKNHGATGDRKRHMTEVLWCNFGGRFDDD
jgi:DNA polymerase I-like protein with 3'-5' exonuclease and polymerase domains/site-specific DNA-adenine methylase